MRAQQLQGDFALLKPRQAWDINSISGKNYKLTHLKWWLKSSEKAKFSRSGRTASSQTQPGSILFGQLTCSPISTHELQGWVCPFFLLILGLDNIFLSQNLPWTKVAAGWSTHQSKCTRKFKLTLPNLDIPPRGHSNSWFLPKMLETHEFQWTTGTPLFT